MATNTLTGSLEDDIYLGFWINRSFGTIRGATLTLDRERGGLLIAFLALFVSASGRGLWKVTRCLLHFVFSSRTKPDGIYLQRQAILRNSRLALDAALELTEACVVWRRNGKCNYRRTVPVASLATLFAICFVVAGIFSSKVSSNSANEALISGRNCNMNLAGHSSPLDNLTALEYETSILNMKPAEHLAYALRCYQDKSTAESDTCKILIKPTLPYSLDSNASCPFSGEMCKSSSGNLVLDTGKLDSYEHFGMNRGPRLSIRVKEHCAPLVTNGHSAIHTDPERSNLNFTRYFFENKNESFTFEVALNTTTRALHSSGDYKVYPFFENYRQLIPQLRSQDAQTTLLFLDSSSVVYTNQTEDPWFSATARANNDDFGEVFFSDEPATVLGCATRRLFCNPELSDTEGCVDAYSDDLEEKFQRAWPNPNDRISLRPLAMVLNQLGSRGIGSFFTARSVPNLLSRHTLYNNLQTKLLPQNQWQKEIEHLSQANLAAMQHFMIDYARGYWIGGDWCNSGNSSCRRLCYSQKVRSSKHYSFSVLGVCIILILGGIISLLSILLDLVLATMFRFSWFQNNDSLRYAYAEWQAGSTLQLQRLAHESLGMGNWSKTDGAVPVTEPGDTLAVLDIRDHKHARLVHPSVELTRIESEGWNLDSKGTGRYAKVPSTEHLYPQESS